MRRILLPVSVVGGVVVLFLLTVVWLFVQSRPVPEDLKIVEPATADIVLKTVATGAIVPRAEVELKSRVSGVVQSLHVAPGQQVTRGDLIAEIKVIPDSASLSQAQSAVRSAKIDYDNATVELERAEGLSSQAALSASELQQARTALARAKAGYDGAWSQLQIVRTAPRAARAT